MVRTEGGHQANGHIESNGKASGLGAAATPGAAASSGLGQLPGITSSICSDLAGWMTQAFPWVFLDLTCASSARF